MPVTDASRRAATQSVRAWLSASRPMLRPVIPVTDLGWVRSVADAGVPSIVGEVIELAGRVETARQDGRFKEIRDASESVRSGLEPILDNLWCLSALRPAAGCGVVGLYETTHLIAGLLVGALQGGTMDELQLATAELEGIVARVQAAHNTDGNDVWATAFGVHSADLCDARGAFMSSRLLAVFHNRYLDLQRRLAVLFSPLSLTELPLPKAPERAHSLIDSPYPLVTLRTAVGVRSLISECFDRDPHETARPRDRCVISFIESIAATRAIS